MKAKLYWFWYRLMDMESRRLRRKVNRIADKLGKACAQQEKHNNKLAEFEAIVLHFLNK